MGGMDASLPWGFGQCALALFGCHQCGSLAVLPGAIRMEAAPESTLRANGRHGRESALGIWSMCSGPIRMPPMRFLGRASWCNQNGGTPRVHVKSQWEAWTRVCPGDLVNVLWPYSDATNAVPWPCFLVQSEWRHPQSPR